MIEVCINNILNHPDFKGKIRQSTLERFAKEANEYLFMDVNDLVRYMTDRAKGHIHKRAKERQRRALQLIKIREYENHVLKYTKDPVKGFISFWAGVQDTTPGSRKSVYVQQVVLQHKYIGDLTTKLKEAGVYEGLFEGKGRLFDDVRREIYFLNSKKDIGSTNNQEAIKAAKVIYDFKQYAINRANAAGADIGFLETFYGTRSHNRFKIRKMTQEQWVDYVLLRVDKQATFGTNNFPDDEAKKILGKLYKRFVSGNHLRYDSLAEDFDMNVFRRGSDTGAPLSRERFLHFKSVEDALQYDNTFGEGNFLESLLTSVRSLARATAIMETAGPNHKFAHEVVMGKVSERLLEEGRLDEARALVENKGRIERQIATTDGSTNIVENNLVNNIDQTISAVQRTSSLGGVVISAFSDIAFSGAALRSNGVPLFKRLQASLLFPFDQMPKKDVQRFGLNALVYVDDTINNLAEMSSFAQDVPGALTRAQNFFFKYTGFTWWTHRHRSSIAQALAVNLGSLKDEAFDALPRRVRYNLQQYNIDAADWDVMRKGFDTASNGVVAITRNAIEKLDGYDAKTIQRVSDKYASYILDQTDSGQIQADSRIQAMMKWGTQSGTIPRAVLNQVMLFKTFPVTVLQRVVGRIMNQYRQEGPVSMIQEMATVMAQATALGFISMTLRDLIAGREPADPSDPKVIARAMAQGGALGFYGDILFGAARKPNTNLAAELAGPTASDIQSLLYGPYSKLVNDQDISAANQLRAVISNIPFQNHFMIKPVLDYMFLHSLYESLDPGYLERMEALHTKRTGQEYFNPPSENRVRLFE